MKKLISIILVLFVFSQAHAVDTQIDQRTPTGSIAVGDSFPTFDTSANAGASRTIQNLQDFLDAHYGAYQYVADSTQADHGVVSGGTNLTLKDISVTVGTSKYAVVIFPHDPTSGNSTAYTFDTSLDLSGNPYLFYYFENGAYIDQVTGDEQLTVYNPANIISRPTQKVFDGDCIAYSTSGPETIERWGGGVASSAAVNTAAIQYAIDSMTAPVINLLPGTYNGRIVSDTPAQVVRIIGSGRDSTTWKNTDNTGKAIFFDTGSYCELAHMTVDLNSTTTTGVDIEDSFFFYIHDMLFKNQAGTAATAVALYMHGAGTHSNVERLRFTDGNHIHMRVDTCNYSTFKDIRTGYAGTDATYSTALWVYNNVGSTFDDVYVEQGQFTTTYILSCQNLKFNNYQFESADTGPTVAGAGNLYIESSRNVRFYGGRLLQYGSATAYMIYFGDVNDVSIDGMLMHRQITSSAKMVWSGGTTNKNISIKNIEVVSYDTTPAAAAADFFGSGATTLTDLVLENISDYLNAGLTFDIHGSRARAINLSGTVVVYADTSSTATVENCDTVNVESSQTVSYRRKGKDFSFDVLQKEIVTSLSGATEDVSIAVPSNALIIGILGNVQTTITGCTSWNADFNNGSTVAIGTGYDVAQNSKLNVLFDQSTNDMRTVDSTNITVTAVGGAGSFSGGTIRFVVMYIKQGSLPDV